MTNPMPTPARWDAARALCSGMVPAERLDPEELAAEALLEAARLEDLEADLRLRIDELEAELARERAVSAQLRRDLESMTRERDAALVGRRETYSRGDRP